MVKRLKFQKYCYLEKTHLKEIEVVLAGIIAWTVKGFRVDLGVHPDDLEIVEVVEGQDHL